MFWHQGNAVIDRDARGWFFGHFAVGERSLNYSSAVELKWSDHSPGDAQVEWQASKSTSVSILISGGMDIAFRDGVAKLRRQGDYAHWAPMVEHRWEAILPSRILTIRWPSK